jgi:hypothetical protein
MAQQFARDVSVDGVRGRGENIVLGLLCGLVAAAIGAGIWMGTEVAIQAQFGLIAIAVGALVGFAVRLGGNGTSAIFGLMGAVLTLASCLTGEILAVAQMASTPERDLFTTLTTMDIGQTLGNIFSHMGAMGFVIYGIGIFEGYKFSIRK